MPCEWVYTPESFSKCGVFGSSSSLVLLVGFVLFDLVAAMVEATVLTTKIGIVVDVSFLSTSFGFVLDLIILLTVVVEVRLSKANFELFVLTLVLVGVVLVLVPSTIDGFIIILAIQVYTTLR